MGFPAVFREVGTKQKRPDVGILSLLSSRPQTLSLGCFLHHYPSAGVNRIEKAVVDRVSSRGCRDPRGAPKGLLLDRLSDSSESLPPSHSAHALKKAQRHAERERIPASALLGTAHTVMDISD